MSERFYSRPRDKSLQAYKDWVQGIVKRVNPNAKDTLTDEEWVEKWKSFWEKADRASDAKNETEK